MSILPNQSSVNRSTNFWTRENRNPATGEISSLEVLENGLGNTEEIPVAQTTTELYNENFVAPTDGKYAVIASVAVSNESGSAQTFTLSIQDPTASAVGVNTTTFTNYPSVKNYRTLTTMFSRSMQGGDNVNLVVNLTSTAIGTAGYSIPTLQCIFSPT